jgi:hypothetical protein
VNLDVFAWKPSDMKRIPKEVAEHKLNIKPGSKRLKQRHRRFNNEKCKAIGEEIKKLLSAGFIREVFHPEWLANSVLVKKKNKKWRMCVDVDGLNSYPPTIRKRTDLHLFHHRDSLGSYQSTEQGDH